MEKMGKKSDCCSEIFKKAFTKHSKKHHLSNKQDSERKKNNKRNKKKILGIKLKKGEINSLLPIFRQPSSIEKILSEAEREQNFIFRPLSPTDGAKGPSSSVPSPLVRPSSPKVPSQRYVSSPRPISPRIASPRGPLPRAVSPRIVQPPREFVYRPKPTLLVQNAYATRIQATFRGYMARRSFRALKGLVRLQGVVRGQSVKWQTMNAMKYMQLLVHAQTQVQSCRFFVPSKDWDDCLLIKKEKEARLHKKIDEMIKREKSMSYAHSNQNNQSNGFPLWCNWVDIQKEQSQASTPWGQSLQSSNQNHLKHDTSTPSSSKSTLFSPSKVPTHTPQPYNSINVSRYSRGGGRRATQDSSRKDDDSLISCPPFSAPSYMAPTVSAKAKLRANNKKRMT